MDKSTRQRNANSEELERWHALPASDVVRALATVAKVDDTYKPVAQANSERWNVDVNDRQFELLLTGPKFWDTREKRGGGGAIDLVMHLMPCSFKQAVALLREHSL